MYRKLFNHIGYCKCCGIKMLLHGYDSQNHISRIMKQKKSVMNVHFGKI